MFPILSRNQIKLIRSLKQKKYRYKFQKYIVEGKKQIADILIHNPKTIDYIVTTDESNNQQFGREVEIYKTGIQELNDLSSLVHPQGVMAICNIPLSYFSDHCTEGGFALYFDGIQDPGNLGTMLRAAEWYGVDQVLIGPGTVDPYSPKVVQSAMGSLTYLPIYQCDYLQLSTFSCPILAADMKGQNAYQFTWPKNGILVLGNEGQGISAEVKQCATNFLTIPSAHNIKTESLNVGMACTALLTLRYLNNFEL